MQNKEQKKEKHVSTISCSDLYAVLKRGSPFIVNGQWISGDCDVPGRVEDSHENDFIQCEQQTDGIKLDFQQRHTLRSVGWYTPYEETGLKAGGDLVTVSYSRFSCFFKRLPEAPKFSFSRLEINDPTAQCTTTPSVASSFTRD